MGVSELTQPPWDTLHRANKWTILSSVPTLSSVLTAFVSGKFLIKKLLITFKNYNFECLKKKKTEERRHITNLANGTPLITQSYFSFAFLTCESQPTWKRKLLSKKQGYIK